MRNHKIHIIYVGTTYSPLALAKEYALAISLERGRGDKKSLVFKQSFLEESHPKLKGCSDVMVSFYTDVYDAVKALQDLGADLMIVDERRGQEGQLAHDEALNGKEVLHVVSPQGSGEPPISLERVKSTIDSFAYRDFHFPMRRVLVVLPREARHTDREFRLGVLHVRGALVEPPHFLQLFLYAIQSLNQFAQNHKRTSLCFSGGGLEGYLYSLGVSAAFDQFFEEKTCQDFDIFCGTSSGGLVAGCLAAGISAHQLVAQVYGVKGRLEPFDIRVVFDFAAVEIAKRGVHLLKILSKPDLENMILQLRSLIPVSLFQGARLRAFIERQLAACGVEDRFDALPKELYVTATDQDTGESVVFGDEPWRDIKVSQALRASAAIPPFYPPEKINGHWFTDGLVSGNSGFTHAIEKGASLVVNVDPIVPYTSNLPGNVMNKGGYFVMLQSAKALIQSRAASMLRHTMDTHPDVDVIQFQPTDKVMEVMAGNPMKYRLKTEITELGFYSVKAQFLESYDALAHKFGKHGFDLKSKQEISNQEFLAT